MKIFEENLIKLLSFPDYEVEKIELSLEEKILKIFIEGAWLDLKDGIQLGKGFLCFQDWESFSMNRFDPHTEKWFTINELKVEPLKDICEMKFTDHAVYLYGFGKQIGQWTEWKIQKAKMHAEFDL